MTALLQILALTNIEHSGTLTSIVEATQKAWLRKAGTERWQCDERFEELRDQLIPLLKQLGVLDEMRPTQMEYEYVVLLGSTVTEFRGMVAALIDYHKQGIRFKKLVIHAGARPLDPVEESKDKLFDYSHRTFPIRADWKEPAELPRTEAEMARMIFDQAEFPPDFKDTVPVEMVEAPLQKDLNGGWRRPNTGDVVNLWLSQGVTPGTLLAISQQPYVLYQDAVLRTLLPTTFTIETVGPQALLPLRIDEQLDNIARWLYQKSKHTDAVFSFKN